MNLETIPHPSPDRSIKKRLSTCTITLGTAGILSVTGILTLSPVTTAQQSGVITADSAHTTFAGFTPKDTSVKVQPHQPVALDTSSVAVRQSNPHPAASSAEKNDSLKKKSVRDSMLAIESKRRKHFFPDSAADDYDHMDIGTIFRSDATGWKDLSPLNKLFIAPRTGIAGHLNRMLFMGNTAAISKIYPGRRLLYETAEHPLYGDDAYFSTEFSSISTSVDGTRSMVSRTGNMISPESEIFWETGVFDENILLLRFTRPLSRQLYINVFSNYRYFDGTAFSHDGSDVYTFFSNITRDTTLLSHKGYNPLVREYFCGADTRWKGEKSELFARVKYGDLTNELPINRRPLNEYPDYARMQQYPLSFTGGISLQPKERYFTDAEFHLVSSPQHWIRSVDDSSGYRTQTVKLKESDLSGALRAGIAVVPADTASLQGTIRRVQVKIADSINQTSFRYRPEAVWLHSFHGSGLLSGSMMLRAGADFYTSDSSGVFSPIWNGTLNISLFNYRCALYVEQDQRHYAPFFDSLAGGATLHDSYLRSGIRMERAWNLFSLLVGYQWCYGVDTMAALRSWTAGTPPYRQPQSVVVLAPGFGRWKGAGLSTRIMLSDTRPYVKLQGELSWLLFPKLTNEAFDIGLEFNYWSKREAVLFAERTDWGQPIIDINFSTSVHIKSFRLMYKIDNVLNRNFSYIPGYTTPGITFRWGFSWFIQR
jgi:hypothetical protein